MNCGPIASLVGLGLDIVGGVMLVNGSLRRDMAIFRAIGNEPDHEGAGWLKKLKNWPKKIAVSVASHGGSRGCRRADNPGSTGRLRHELLGCYPAGSRFRVPVRWSG